MPMSQQYLSKRRSEAGDRKAIVRELAQKTKSLQTVEFASLFDGPSDWS